MHMCVVILDLYSSSVGARLLDSLGHVPGFSLGLDWAVCALGLHLVYLALGSTACFPQLCYVGSIS